MQLTSAHCRTQEALQWDRAKDEPLKNVRVVALRAAIAWGHEATSAERREARTRRARVIAELSHMQKQLTANEDEQMLSENPDRGFADA